MDKIKVTAQQRANAVEALEVMWPSVPPENVYPLLRGWRRGGGTAPPTCGTVACFGGWCAWWPTFRAQGVSVDPDDGWPTIRGSYPTAVSASLFGSAYLFGPRNKHLADHCFTGTDHALVTNRLRWLIKNSVVEG